MALNFLIFVVGPTAIGKTNTSIHLAKHFNAPILSADSRQFFKEMNIGTAKPSEEELSMAKHYFINNKSIHDNYNVGLFEMESIETLDSIYKSGNIAIVVGGSGLYINAICDGLDELPETEEGVREELIKLHQEKGITQLQELLKQHDPVYYNEVDIQNPQRIMRALEVCISSGTPFSTFRKKKSVPRNFIPIKIGLNIDREELYKKINLRVDEMMKNGLLEEVKQFLQYKTLNPLQTVGYKELFDYLENKISLEEAVEKTKQNTRNFAKRQLTWFRKDMNIKWFEPLQQDEIIKYIETIILQNNNAGDNKGL